MLGFDKNNNAPSDDRTHADKLLDSVNYGGAKEELKRKFRMVYAPYLIEGYAIPERRPEDIPFEGADARQLRVLASAVDKKRAENPYVGASLASDAVYNDLLTVLKGDGEKGVHAESLLAILGTLGGLECMRGVMKGTEGMTSDELFALGVMILGTANGESYIMGDLIGNEFMSFYMTAAKDRTSPVEVLQPIAARCAETLGSEDFQKTPYSGSIPNTPRELAEMFGGRYEKVFSVYTRFPHERMMTMALAAQKAADQTAELFGKEKTMSILAEYGWRASHFISE